jgi:hypothetical protein
MNKTKQTKKEKLFLRQNYLLNGAFSFPTLLTVAYIYEGNRITAWVVLLLILFLCGLTYREKWTFTKKSVQFVFSLFTLPLQQKRLPTHEIKALRLNTFIRGEKGHISPNTDKKWHQTIQAVLILIKTDESELVLKTGTNKQTTHLLEKGEEIARFLDIPFYLNL